MLICKINFQLINCDFTLTEIYFVKLSSLVPVNMCLNSSTKLIGSLACFAFRPILNSGDRVVT